jgi:hypothetical protein
MPIQINCPSCKGTVRVPEDLLGKRVQCPRCQATFVAEIDDEPGPAPPAAAKPPVGAGETVAPRPRRPARVDEIDDFDDYEDRPRRRYGRPHRGGAILTLGILSLIICAPLGIFAWVMGSNDLTEMKRGQMDRSGEGLTQAGRILGIIACVLMILGCVFYGVFFALLGARHHF